jgi:hypothetical protein
MARIPVSALVDGSVLFDGRVARIVGFDGGVVKLRFTDGGEDGDGFVGVVRVGLADFLLLARVSDPGEGSDDPGPAPMVPWEPTGQRANHVRETLNGYVRGRRAALHELEARAPRSGS